MSPFLVLSIQSTLSLVVFSLMARWHVAARLQALPREAALVPLLWVQVFRYASLTLYAPGQVNSRIPPDFAATVGLGDLAPAVVALVALVALHVRMKGSIALA